MGFVTPLFYFFEMAAARTVLNCKFTISCIDKSIVSKYNGTINTKSVPLVTKGGTVSIWR